MQFLYVFALMFLSTFGLVMLVKLFAKALLDGSARKFEIYVRDDGNIEELLMNLRNNPNIGRVCVIADGDLTELEKKYDGVKIVKAIPHKDRRPIA